MDKILEALKAGKAISTEEFKQLEASLSRRVHATQALAAPTVKDGVKILGSEAHPVTKVLPIHQLKAERTADGLVVVKGYANTKNSKDRYGDIPTVFPALRNYVYELGDFTKNPVMLLDHDNCVGSIAGSFRTVKEDDLGLYVEGVFSQSDYGPVAHARTVYSEGHGKAFSIAGIWYFEDKENPDHLTYAKIFEISCVGVGADPNALGVTETESQKTKEQLESEAKAKKDAEALDRVRKTIEQMKGTIAERNLREEIRKLGESLRAQA